MAIMDMMQAAIHQVVDMIAMGNGFVAAIGAMDMIGCVAAALAMSALVGIGGANGDDVFVDVIAMHVVQVTIVKIVDVPVMLDGGVSAIRPMLMAVIGVMLVAATAHATDSEKGGCRVTPGHYKV
ncbi:hypothetical protein [Pseudomonas oryzihabitans]|uniref:hypothetical protein n=1 Tax=Pseudomonas oryzihabitans TaxID=47885 RepID=UPI002893BACD|nr:hypothetical protein [Pseudomonas oryzihabitans]MDT3722385.1 hypothetical protein [Pseudomonas oryzihabitans]